MNEALAREKYRATALQKQIFGVIADRYRGSGDVVHFEEDLSSAGVRELAEAIAGTCCGVAAVFSGSEGRFDVCLACPGGDVKELGSRMAKEMDGKGGGKPGFFQGVLKTRKEQILRFFGRQYE